MIVGYARKQPIEVFPISVDFAKDLASGETIVSPTVTARHAQTDADTSSALLQGSPAVLGTTAVAQKVKAGATGERHLMTYRIVTSLANTYEAEVQLAVEED